MYRTYFFSIETEDSTLFTCAIICGLQGLVFGCMSSRPTNLMNILYENHHHGPFQIISKNYGTYYAVKLSTWIDMCPRGDILL